MAETANITSEQSNIVHLVPRDHARTFRTEFTLFEGYKRRQWTVVERAADGNETCIAVSRGRHSEAVYMANLLTRHEAKRSRDMQQIARHPIGAQLMALPPEDRRLISGILAMIKTWEARA